MNSSAEFSARIASRFSELVREGMITRDKTVRGLADEIGVSPKTIQDVRDARHVPGLDLAAQLAIALGFDLDQVRG